MNYAENPVEDLASSLYHALAVGLPDIEYQGIDYSEKTIAEMKQTNLPMSQWPKITKKRRPAVRDLDNTLVFQETWGGGALGFGGMSTAALTTANTVVIQCGVWTAVYWAGRLGYIMRTNGASAQFFDQIKNYKTPSRKEALLQYGTNTIIPDEK